MAPHAAVELENTADVLRVCVEVGERPGILHWVFDELKEAVIGTYPRRVIRHEVARSVEVDLLRGLHVAGRRRGSRKILKERSRAALSSSPTPSLPPAIPCPNIPTSHVSRRLLRGLTPLTSDLLLPITFAIALPAGSTCCHEKSSHTGHDSPLRVCFPGSSLRKC